MRKNQTRERDLGTSSDRAMYGPSEERGRGESSERNREDQQSGMERNRDAGRTSGGGSGGHTPSRDFQDQTRVRNVPMDRGD